jgi:trehalose 6-phosphate synthase
MNEKSILSLQSRRSVIIASNRGPITFHRNENGELLIRRGSGGLVTALSGLAGQIDAAWISCASTSEDKTFQEGEIPWQKNGETLHIRFINPSFEAYNGYYNHIANPLLWFLQHSMWNVPHQPVIDKETWQAWNEGYIPVNKFFANAIINQLSKSPKNTLVMLQDYHLYLTPWYIRNQLKPINRPTILHFIHIPWPGPEYWGILPPTMRHDILNGLCSVDVLGLQTQNDALNFIRTCETYLPRASVKYKRRRIWYRNHATHVRDFPISIDVQSLQNHANSPEVMEYESIIKEIVGEQKLILRIDRIEPSKNIVRGFQAFEEFLELFPEYIEKVIFLALLVPSRMDVDEYQDYLDVLMASAGQVNAKFGTPEWEPVRVLVGDNYSRAIAALKFYDVLLVNAIADGMNLVAKEGPIVNHKDGVLVLSERTGAQQQLATGAIIIPPCDIYATAQALQQGLSMPRDERHQKADRLRWLIENDDIVDWLYQQLETVEKLKL